MILDFLLSLIQTMFFMIFATFMAVLGMGLWFLYKLRNGVRGGQQQSQQRQRAQAYQGQQRQQAQEAKPDPAEFEQPIFDDANAEYVDYEEIKNP